MPDTIKLTPSAVLIDGTDVTAHRDAALFRSCLPVPERELRIPLHGTGTRIEAVWDSLGLVAYWNLPEEEMTHFYLAFSSSDTPGRPTSVFTGSTLLNRSRLAADLSPATIPKNGELPISEQFHRYFHKADKFTVDLGFAKRRTVQGRRAGTERLAWVSISWNRPE